LNLRYLLDTDICIYVLKNKPVELGAAFDLHAHELCVSSVTAMELQYGVERSARRLHNQGVLDSFLSRMPVLSYDLEAARHTAIIRADLAQRGQPIGAYDQMIAGIARSRALTVVTNNEREFSRVKGLEVENWLKKSGTLLNEPGLSYR